MDNTSWLTCDIALCWNGSLGRKRQTLRRGSWRDISKITFYVSAVSTPGNFIFKHELIIPHHRLHSYLGDADATKASFDDEGFFKTGDLAHLESGEYIFDGRAKTDCKLQAT